MYFPRASSHFKLPSVKNSVVILADKLPRSTAAEYISPLRQTVSKFHTSNIPNCLILIPREISICIVNDACNDNDYTDFALVKFDRWVCGNREKGRVRLESPIWDADQRHGALEK